ncbi:hypothetical protein BsWGS_06121 [Bradybaena similaris]
MTSSAQKLNVEPPKEMSPKVHNVQFYRRPLPPSCIAFTSEEGKQIFAEALAAGHMNCFFKLCAQYRTQDEPAYCGLTSLVMALNVLEIDPGRVWKGPWRWYHEDMLDCCTSLQVAREKGINMEQFTCLAKCNNLTAVATSASDITSVDELRAQIKNAAQREDVVFVASYTRKVLGQTGDGHFSPIAGYHEERDLALILDTARFKYPPHWVPVTLLLDSMRPLDRDTGRPRGYILLSSAENQPGLLLFRPSCAFTVDTKKGKLNPQLVDFAREWAQWLSKKILMPMEQKTVIHQALSFLLGMKTQGHFLVSMFCLTLPFVRSKENSAEYLVECQTNKELTKVTCAIKHLLTELEALDTFKVVQEFFSTKSPEEKSKFLNLIQEGEDCVKEHDPADKTSSCCKTSCCNKPSSERLNDPGSPSNPKIAKLTSDSSDGCASCVGTLKIGPEHAVTLFLSTWPHATAISSNASHPGSSKELRCGSLCESVSTSTEPCSDEQPSTESVGFTGKLLMDFITSDINKVGLEHVKAEIATIKFKLREVIKYHSPGFTSYCCSGNSG